MRELFKHLRFIHNVTPSGLRVVYMSDYYNNVGLSGLECKGYSIISIMLCKVKAVETSIYRVSMSQSPSTSSGTEVENDEEGTRDMRQGTRKMR